MKYYELKENKKTRSKHLGHTMRFSLLFSSTHPPLEPSP